MAAAPKFPTDTHVCPRCRLRLHRYHFPRVRRAEDDARSFDACCSCLAEEDRRG